MRPHLYKRPCPSVGPLVGPSVMLSSKSMKNGLLRILNDLDSAGRGKEGWGGRRDEEEGGTRRKEGRGEWKNEKVVKKWKMKKSLKDASLASLGLVPLNIGININHTDMSRTCVDSNLDIDTQTYINTHSYTDFEALSHSKPSRWTGFPLFG